MGGESGYDYSYRLWVDDEVIAAYPDLATVYRTRDIYAFEFRANFKVKKIDDDALMLGSEKFLRPVCYGVPMDSDFNFRLKRDYGMPDQKLKSLIRDAKDFADKQRAAAAEVIPVVVEVDVWTVQMEDERIEATLERSIRPESLIPLSLWPIDKVSSKTYMHRCMYLWELPRIRVVDEEGLDLMGVCPICSRENRLGGQVAFYPCGHACHALCIYERLEKKVSARCPVCGFLIPRDFGPPSEDDYLIHQTIHVGGPGGKILNFNH